MNSQSEIFQPCGGRWAVIAVGLSTFAVVTTEMLPVGLMTPIADQMGTSVGMAGLMISIPAALAAVCAPMVILAAGSVDRRRILAGLLVLLTLSNIASALSSSMTWLLAARGIVGICMGGIWAIAGGLAPRLVAEASIGRATAIIFGGVAAASVFGVPIGAVIGDALGWRAAFCVMAVFSVAVLGLNLWALPSLSVRRSMRVPDFMAQMRRIPVILGLALTLLLVAGHFMAYTFIRPILLDHSGFDVEWLGALLLAYGIAGILGNFVTGAVVAGRQVATLFIIALTLAAAISGLALFGGNIVGGLLIVILWGLGYGGVSVGLQSWMMRAAPAAIEVSTALFVSVFNIAIAVGSAIGGWSVDGYGLENTLLFAAAFPAIAVALVIFMNRRA